MTKKERAIIYKQNAQASTGPKTQEGKDISRYNSLKHGLDSKRLIRYDEDEKEQFETIRKNYEAEYHPDSVAEWETVNGMCETQWQLLRIRRLIEIAFFRGGELWETSKTIENYSRHQARLHKQEHAYRREMEMLMEARQMEIEEAAAPPSEPKKKKTGIQLLRRPPASPLTGIRLGEIGFVSTQKSEAGDKPPIAPEKQP